MAQRAKLLALVGAVEEDQERLEINGRETILVADDDDAILAILELVLQDAGYDVIKASDGAEALELVSVHRPDLVLLDLMMPNLDGCTACQRLKSADDTSCLPVVIMSADRRVATLAVEAKANAYFFKPFDLDQILTSIRGWLARGHKTANAA